MSQKNEAKKLKISALLNDIRTLDTAKAKTALQSLKVHGDISVIEPLLHFQNTPQGENLKSDIHLFLSDISDEAAIEEFIRILNSPLHIDYQTTVLNILWNSKLNFSGYIDHFVELAVNGDFMVTLECLTILENLQGPFNEASIIESQLSLSKYSTHPSKNEQKDVLISDIATIILAIERSIDG